MKILRTSEDLIGDYPVQKRRFWIPKTVTNVLGRTCCLSKILWFVNEDRGLRRKDERPTWKQRTPTLGRDPSNEFYRGEMFSTVFVR